MLIWLFTQGDFVRWVSSPSASKFQVFNLGMSRDILGLLSLKLLARYAAAMPGLKRNPGTH